VKGGASELGLVLAKTQKRTPEPRIYHLRTDNTEICFPILLDSFSSILHILLPHHTDPSMGFTLSFSLDIHAADSLLCCLLYRPRLCIIGEMMYIAGPPSSSTPFPYCFRPSYSGSVSLCLRLSFINNVRIG